MTEIARIAAALIEGSGGSPIELPGSVGRDQPRRPALHGRPARHDQQRRPRRAPAGAAAHRHVEQPRPERPGRRGGRWAHPVRRTAVPAARQPRRVQTGTWPGADARRHRANTRVGDYTVYLQAVRARPTRLETSLISDPPLGERDLQTLLVTGQRETLGQGQLVRPERGRRGVGRRAGIRRAVPRLRLGGRGHHGRSRAGVERRGSGAPAHGVEAARQPFRARAVRQPRRQRADVGDHLPARGPASSSARISRDGTEFTGEFRQEIPVRARRVAPADAAAAASGAPTGSRPSPSAASRASRRREVLAATSATSRRRVRLRSLARRSRSDRPALSGAGILRGADRADQTAARGRARSAARGAGLSHHARSAHGAPGLGLHRPPAKWRQRCGRRGPTACWSTCSTPTWRGSCAGTSSTSATCARPSPSTSTLRQPDVVTATVQVDAGPVDRAASCVLRQHRDEREGVAGDHRGKSRPSSHRGAIPRRCWRPCRPRTPLAATWRRPPRRVPSCSQAERRPCRSASSRGRWRASRPSP